jgi:hypothetical protein
MNLPTQMGRYLAVPTDWSVQESGDNRLATFVCQFSLTQFLVREPDGDLWADVSHQGLEITGYFYLTKKDGTLNVFQLNALQSALGWDGASVRSLAEGDWSSTEIQLTIAEEEYQGKRKVKIQFINPRDWTGDAIQKDPQLVQSLEAKYGSQLRALNGGKAKPAAANNAKPAATGTPQEQVMREAWAKFQEQHAGGSKEHIAAQWKEKVKAYFGDRQPTAVGLAEWRQFITDRFAKPVEAPFGDEQALDPSDIPF